MSDYLRQVNRALNWLKQSAENGANLDKPKEEVTERIRAALEFIERRHQHS